MMDATLKNRGSVLKLAFLKRINDSLPHWLPPALLSLLVSFTCWDHFLRPAFWDETKVYLGPLFNLQQNFWAELTRAPTPYDRPLGLNLLYLPFLHVFGPHVLVVRIVNFILLQASFWLFYYAVPARQRGAALLSLALLILTPVCRVYFLDYVCEYQFFFGLCVVLYLLARHPGRTKLLFLSLLLVGTLRETALCLVPMVLTYNWRQKTYSSRQLWVLASAPLWGTLLHWGRNYALSGEFFLHVSHQTGALDWFAGPSARWKQLLGPWLTSYRLLPLVLAALVALPWQLRRKRALAASELYMLVAVLAYLYVFTGHGATIPRYYLAVMPFTFFLLLRWTEDLIRSPKVRIPVTLGLIAACVSLGDPTTGPVGGLLTHRSGLQDGTQRPRIVEQHRRVRAHVTSVLRAGDRVLVGWPFQAMLKSSNLGDGPAIEWTAVTKESNTRAPDLMIWTNFPEQIPLEEFVAWEQRARYQRLDFSEDYHKVIVFVRTD